MTRILLPFWINVASAWCNWTSFWRPYVAMWQLVTCNFHLSRIPIICILPENTDAMAEIRRVARIPIATGERLFGRYAFKELLVKQAVDVIQADVGNAGGILEVYKIAAMAEA